MPAGSYDFPFSFEVPGDCPVPPSLESRIGTIRYYLSSKIDRPGIKIDNKKRLRLELIPKVETNKPEYAADTKITDDKTLCCCCCADGPIKVDFEAPVRACAPGDHMEVKVNIDNKSSKSFTGYSIVLREDTTYYAGFHMNHTQRYTNTINVTTETENILPTTEFSKKINVVIPQAGPTFDINVGKAIKRFYSMGVFIKVPGPHKSICICAPMILGTVPRNASAASSSSSSSSSSNAAQPAAAAAKDAAGDVSVPAGPDSGSEPDYLTKLNQQLQNESAATAAGASTTTAGDAGASSSEYILSTPAGGNSRKDRRNRGDDAEGTGDEWTGMYGY